LATRLLRDDDLIMIKYEIIGKAIELTGGILHLTPEQAKSRLHALKPLNDGLFEILKTVTFKVGEKIGFNGDIPKALAGQIIDSAKSKLETEAVEAVEELVKPKKLK